MIKIKALNVPLSYPGQKDRDKAVIYSGSVTTVFIASQPRTPRQSPKEDKYRMYVDIFLVNIFTLIVLNSLKTAKLVFQFNQNFTSEFKRSNLKLHINL